MPFKRNLIYYICPFKNNNEWRLNIREIVKYWDAFNNKKIVAVIQGQEFVDIKKIKEEFNDNNIEYIVMENDRRLGEVRPFKKMMKSVFSLDPCELTFYAHAKGVSPRYKNRTNRHCMKNIRIWRNAMYYYCLRDPEYIDRVLSDFSCCGCFKRIQHVGQSPCQWHYAGTYFWFNNNKVFLNKNWDEVIGDRWAVEGYLGCKFPEGEAFCIFGEYRPRYELIDMSEDHWNTILPDFLTAKDFEYGYNRI